jgi:arylsulfatase A-like enzyme
VSSEPPTAPSPPDIVVVVLDAARYDVFQEVFVNRGKDLEGFGALDDLRKEAVRFDRTASPAPWTLPAHASLFTGLYPWQHGTHGRGALDLPADLPSLASLLRQTGYQTICLSANAFIKPGSGLVRGFDEVIAASWDAPFFRWGSLERGGSRRGRPHPQQASEGPAPTDLATSRLETQVLTRFPFLVDIWNRLARRFRPEEFDSSNLSVSPWIERVLERWLASLDPGQPFFAFVNLLDAHDPYLTDDSRPVSIRSWWRLMRVSQSQAHHILYPKTFTAEDREVLLTLYSQTMVNLARRVGHLVGTLQAHGRWKNTLFVLTSDHGQSFGEHGWLFHGSRLDEPLVRIPLWVRFPFARHAGASPAVWASLVDIAPTAVSLAGVLNPPDFSGMSLERLIELGVRGPVLSASDGMADRIQAARWLPPARFEELDRVRAAAYEGNRKVTLDQGDLDPRAFDPINDAAEGHDLWSSESQLLAPLRGATEEALSAMASSQPKPVPASVRDRLASWGYV